MFRHCVVIGLTLCLLPVTASDATAQRSGFIIGFGVGGAATTGDPETRGGFATDLRIGAVVTPSVQVYFTGKSNYVAIGEGGTEAAITGLSGLGITYQLPNGLSVNGAVGVATWVESSSGGAGGGVGPGLGAGVGYEFADPWILFVGVTWGRINDVTVTPMNVINLSAGISILSH